MSDVDEVIGNDAAAAYVGLKPATWRPYVKRGQAPPPDRREISTSGHALPVWKKATLDAWKQQRPGQGARTDLANLREQG